MEHWPGPADPAENRFGGLPKRWLHVKPVCIRHKGGLLTGKKHCVIMKITSVDEKGG